MRCNVVGAFTEPGQQPSRIADALAAELHTMASWLGLDEITVGDRGDMAAELAKAVG